jgi:hypothetical protein
MVPLQPLAATSTTGTQRRTQFLKNVMVGDDGLEPPTSSL